MGHSQGIHVFSSNFVLSSVCDDFAIVIRCYNFHFFLLLSAHCSSAHPCCSMISHNASQPSPGVAVYTSHVGGESGGAGERGRTPLNAVPWCFQCEPSVTSCVLDSALPTIGWRMHHFSPGCGRFGPAGGRVVELTAKWQLQTGAMCCYVCAGGTRHRPRPQKILCLGNKSPQDPRGWLTCFNGVAHVRPTRPKLCGLLS